MASGRNAIDDSREPRPAGPLRPSFGCLELATEGLTIVDALLLEDVVPWLLALRLCSRGEKKSSG